MKLKFYVFAHHLDEDEEILAVAHRHPFILLMASYKVIFLAMVLPVVGYYYFPQYILVFLIWFCVGVVGFLYHYLDWFFDAWLITNMGIIDIERNGLFDRNSTRVDYHMIEGMAISIKGFWNTVLNFGTITIDKLGARTTLSLVDAMNPKSIERKIIKIQEDFVIDKSIRDHDSLKTMLSEMIAYHVQNNKIKPPRR